MSLINDALKRAKQAQESADCLPPVPPLRPVEPAQTSVRHSLGVLLPIALAVVALLGLMLFWVLWKKEGSGTTPQNVAPITVSARTPAAEPVSVPTETATGASTSLSGIAPNHSENAVAANVTANASVTNPVSSTPGSNETNRLEAQEPAPPSPPPLKLQSIVYSPKRPSALINGRVLFVGDRIRDFRVTAIHREDVVLTGGGHTNLLSLDP